MPQPNLLFLFTDEQRFDTLAAYGNKRIRTPALNRLAEQSCVFDRAYVTQPVCTPSRSSLLTGLYPHTNGCTENNVALAEDVPAFAELLSEDYATGYFGKWHLGDEIFAQHGFDEWRSTDDCYAKYYRPGRPADEISSYAQWLINQGVLPRNGRTFGRGETAELDEQYSKPKYLADETVAYLRDRADQPDQPFCLFVNFFEPHMPFTGPRNDQHDPAQVPLPDNFHATPTEDQPLKTRLFQHLYAKHGQTIPLNSEADFRRLIANYWGLCSLVDTHVGRILETLDETGLSEETIVVYTSDHGDMMGSHRLVAKCVQFEEAIRVPLLLRLPGQQKGCRIGGLVSQIDLVPTLLELMGQPIPAHLQGVSRAGTVFGDAAGIGDDVIVEWQGPNNGMGDTIGQVQLPEDGWAFADRDELVSACTDPVRTILSADGWKMSVSPTRGEHELYDLNADPGETTNLAGDPAQRDRMNDLLERIKTWQATTGDAVALPESL